MRGATRLDVTVWRVWEMDWGGCHRKLTMIGEGVRTLQAVTNIHAHTSLRLDVALDAMSFTASSLRDTLSRRRVAPHTSAVARWTSGWHWGSTSQNAFQACCKSSASTDGTRTYLNSAENVARRAVRASADRERGRSWSSRLRTRGYSGEMVVRRSCASF